MDPRSSPPTGRNTPELSIGRLTAPTATDSGGPPAITARDLGWTYRGRFRPALQRLSFSVEPGHVLLVLGPSGSGKSSLARAIAGLIPHVLPGTWLGRLEIGSLSVTETPARVVAGRVGLVFQDPESQLVMHRVEDEVAFGLENLGWPLETMRARVPDVLDDVGLTGFEPRATATLSGGEQQRLAIADVLAPAPDVLVFDEPTANLDPPGMEGTFERIGELARRRSHTIIIIEHRLEAVLPLADEILILDDEGRQLGFGRPEEVARRHAGTLAKLGGWVPSAWSQWLAPNGDARMGDGRDRARTEVTASKLGASNSPAQNGAAVSSADGHPVIEARALTVTAPRVARTAPSPRGRTPPARTRLLSDIDMALREGERVALVGPNGAGKSTLLFALAGLRKPDRGTTTVGDGRTPPSEDPARLPAKQLARHIAFVFQDPELGFLGKETVRHEILAGHGVGEVDADAVLERFGLDKLATVSPFRLSQGEQRRLSLAAIAHQGAFLLLLDEPTFGLDRRGAEAVVELLDELRAAGQAQLIATHDLRVIRACERVIALDEGRIVLDGSVDAFLAAPPFEPARPWRMAEESEAAPIQTAGPSRVGS